MNTDNGINEIGKWHRKNGDKKRNRKEMKKIKKK